jgi:hypothetical protein
MDNRNKTNLHVHFGNKSEKGRNILRHRNETESHVSINQDRDQIVFKAPNENESESSLFNKLPPRKIQQTNSRHKKEK